MTRVECAVTETLGAAARVYDGMALEVIVRFGTPGREALIETQAWGADVAVLFGARWRQDTPWRISVREGPLAGGTPRTTPGAS
jgi:hypothetical protein